MLDAARVRWRALRRRAHVRLRSHPRLHALLHMRGSLHPGPEAVARGVAVGLFIGLTPTVGVQTALMILCCVLVAGNFPVAFAVSLVSNPLTLGPLYWGFHELGEEVLALSPGLLLHADTWSLRGVGDDILLTLLGSLVVAIPAAVLGYLFSRRVAVAVYRRRDLRRGSLRARRPAP